MAGLGLHRWLACAIAVFLAGAASAIDLEKLVMPGPVVEAHADTEAECSACHSPFDAAAEPGLCIECHEDVGRDVELREGFHGLSPTARTAPCRSCHSDHQGRDADIVGLNPALFDHDFTDYPLHGAHESVPCASCHEPDEKHRDAPSDCVGCHRDDDPHKERLGTDCQSCHTEQRWDEARFDHDETDFPLEGAHADTRCGSCHAGERYEDTASDCVSCHGIDDVHKGSFGESCDTCHGVVDWKRHLFDHDRDTDFALVGRHIEARCESCHTGHLYEQELGTTCISCHRSEDVHRGRFGEECQTCHAEASWARLAFDHDADTDFALLGAHVNVACDSCHRGNVHDPLEDTCVSCHAKDDVHRGEQGEDCAACHDEASWTKRVVFDHELTAFPLLGMHATVGCESCHRSGRFKEAETDCVECHLEDDTHERTLGSACATCHNPNAWSLWRFDHDTQTTFALHGAHEGVDCRTCHDTAVLPGARVEAPESCVECHADEDVHRGAFGRDCTQCHTEESWDDLQLSR
ncbi:MAG: cytochrome c3 family protein [Myxococcota bacterium]|nr:cytochrome c3 family protein [Myxococcota bacterium]